MNKDRLEGATKQVAGGAKEATGKVLHDTKLTAEGIAEKTEGKIQNAIGGVKDAAKS